MLEVSGGAGRYFTPSGRSFTLKKEGYLLFFACEKATFGLLAIKQTANIPIILFFDINFIFILLIRYK